MSKINQKEYEILKSLDEWWKWIARDFHHDQLWVYMSKPLKKENEYWDAHNLPYKMINDVNELFQFVQSGEDEPFSISKLIEEYERDD